MSDKAPLQYQTEPYNDDLIKSAIARIKKLAHHNGVDPKSISLKDKMAATYSADAVTIIRFQSGLEEQKKAPPSFNVSDVSSLKEAETTHKQMLDHAMNDPAFADYMQSVFSQSGSGLGAEDKEIPISRLSGAYKITESCQVCEGRRAQDCQYCRVTGQETCTDCSGQKLTLCWQCAGRGTMPSDNGDFRQCDICVGQQRIPCKKCGGSGMTSCHVCHGKKSVTCGQCGGRGSDSKILVAQTTAIPTSAVNPMQIPDMLKTLINKQGLRRLAAGGHIDVMTMKKDAHKNLDLSSDEIAKAEERFDSFLKFPPKRAKNEIHLNYALKIPFADLTMEIAGKKVDVRLLGKKGTIADMPAFLNTIVSRETQNLERGIKGPGQGVGALKKALEFRFMQTALTLFFEHKPKEAMRQFMKEYGLAIDKSHTRALFHALHEITTAMTAKNRMLSGLAGLITGITGIAAYWHYGINTIVSESFEGYLGIAASAAADFSALILLCTLASKISDQIQKFFLTRGFSQFSIRKIRKVPKAGTIASLTPFCIIVLYLVAIFMNPDLGGIAHERPLWMRYLISLI